MLLAGGPILGGLYLRCPMGLVVHGLDRRGIAVTPPIGPARSRPPVTWHNLDGAGASAEVPVRRGRNGTQGGPLD
ncbi:hypothetical protein GCM10027072_47520 [Streptomyces bullii]